MIAFIKRHQIFITFALVLLSIAFFYIPSEEKRYFHQDLRKFEKQTQVVFIWVLGILAVIFFLLTLRTVKKVEDFFVNLIYAAGAGYGLFILFQTIFYAGALFLNKVSGRQTTDQPYVVSLIEGGNLILRRDTSSIYWIEPLDRQAKSMHLKMADTVIIGMKRGLLGYDFDPVIRGVKPAGSDKAGDESDN